MSDEVTRRQFVRQAGAVLGAGAVIGAAAGAAEAKDDKAKPIAFPFSEYKELAKIGGSAEAELDDGTPVIIAHVDENQFACCGRKCPHQNGDLEYDPKQKRFHCPAHGSNFDLSGKVLNGPARKDVACYGTDPAVLVQQPD